MEDKVEDTEDADVDATGWKAPKEYVGSRRSVGRIVFKPSGIPVGGSINAAST